MQSFRRLLRTVLLGLVVASLPLATASAWINDQDANKIDDRIEMVDANGIAFAYEDNDPTKRLTIGLFDGTPIEYAIYVGYDHHPTAADEAALSGVVGPTAPIKTYFSIDYTRTQADFAEIQQITGLPGVTRVEAIPMMYPVNHLGSRVVRARASEGLSAAERYELFPSAREHLGLDGTGIVIAILDTGVNDAPDDVNVNYPGHESLVGKFLGGGSFFSGDPNLNTGPNESENPQDNVDFHGTHVAGTAMATGGQDAFFTGVAPAARLVDCKVLSDAGAGFGSADGIDWCIQNMTNDWGLTGADTIYTGIDVLNLSLGCLNCSSDGTSAGEQVVNNAANAGLVLAIATGNDDAINQIGSPAAADLSIAVGATTHVGSIAREDDQVTDFSNEGPRADDGDADDLDEMKPNVVAPGAGIMSANGDWSTEGESYNKLSGTSMATPHVAGVAALVKQANPNLTSLQIREIIQNTAIHHIPSQKGNRAPDPFNVDPNYDPMSGWGLVDVYAAGREAINSTSGVQVTRIKAEARPLDGEIDVKWWTQREFTFLGFNVHRAVDVGGAPGAFSQINTLLVPPAGDPVIEGDDNRTPYVFVDDDPTLTLNTTYWYQIEWVDVSGGNLEPPVPVEFGQNPRVATVFYSIQHNTPDNDLTVRVGTSSSYTPELAEFVQLGPGTAAADSVVVHEPVNAATTTVGNQEWFWSLGFTVGDGLGAFFPPSMLAPWFLNVTDDCFINRTGTIQSFSIFVNDSPGSGSGTTFATDTPLPLPTGENCLVPGPDQSSTAWIPEQQPVPAELLRLSVEGETDGIRIQMELLRDLPGATARVSRALTSDFGARRSITPEPIAFEGTSFEYLDAEVNPGTLYWYWVEVEDRTGYRVLNGPVAASRPGTGFERTFALAPAPNPTLGSTVFAFTVGRDLAAGGEVPVELTVHDTRGRKIRTLASGTHGVGEYSITWDLRDDHSASVTSGMYFYRFTAGAMVRTGKVLVSHSQ